MVNPAQYIELEVKYGASAIATQISHSAQAESSYFGTVIFTRANRADIATLSDLKGKSLITASKTACASWVVTRDELMREGIEYGGLSSVRFANSSADKVQYPLKNIYCTGSPETNAYILYFEAFGSKIPSWYMSGKL